MNKQKHTLLEAQCVTLWWSLGGTQKPWDVGRNTVRVWTRNENVSYANGLKAVAYWEQRGWRVGMLPHFTWSHSPLLQFYHPLSFSMIQRTGQEQRDRGIPAKSGWLCLSVACVLAPDDPLWVGSSIDALWLPDQHQSMASGKLCWKVSVSFLRVMQ